MAGDSPASTTRAFELAGDQVRRLAAGEPLINEVARYLLERPSSSTSNSARRELRS
jgi:hypothetical protein